MYSVAWQKQSRGNRNPFRFLGVLRGPSTFYLLVPADRVIRVEELPSGRFAVRHCAKPPAIKYVTGLRRAMAFAEEWLLAKVTEEILKHNALQEKHPNGIRSMDAQAIF